MCLFFCLFVFSSSKSCLSVCSPGSVCRMKIPVPAPALPPLHLQLTITTINSNSNSSSNSNNSRTRTPQRSEKAKPAWARPPNSSPPVLKGELTLWLWCRGEPPPLSDRETRITLLYDDYWLQVVVYPHFKCYFTLATVSGLKFSCSTLSQINCYLFPGLILSVFREH